MERTTPPACDDVQPAARSHEPFFVSATLLTGTSCLVDLSPAAGTDCHGADTTVAQTKARIVACQGMWEKGALDPDQIRLIFEGKRLEDSRPLSHYGLRHSGSRLHVVVRLRGGLFFPLAPAPDPANDVVGDCTSIFSTPGSSKEREKRADICSWLRDRVHLWRVGKDTDWAELIIEPGGPYEGGAFLLRVAFPQIYPFRAVQLRLITPLYHPTVGPAGIMAVIGYGYPGASWSPARSVRKPIIDDFIQQLQSYSLGALSSEILKAEVVQPRLLTTLHLLYTRGKMGDVLNEVATIGEEGARAKARLWTWHYATDHGRAYMRSGRRCSGMAQLASLIAADPQLRNEVRSVLLVAHRWQWKRQHQQQDEDKMEAFAGEEEGWLLGALPRELLHAVLVFIGSDRRPPPPAALMWELVNEGDDGLPEDWRSRLPELPPAL